MEFWDLYLIAAIWLIGGTVLLVAIIILLGEFLYWLWQSWKERGRFRA